MTAPLNTAVSLHNEIRDRLARIYDLDRDDEAVSDTALGESSIDETIAGVLREAKLREALADGITPYIDRLKERQKRLEDGARKMRELALWAMQEVGLSKLKMPDMSVSITPGRRKITWDQNRLPPEFVREVRTYEADRKAIEAAVDMGDVPEGVEISNGAPSIRVVMK